jgi:acetyl-CoA/propionyl-CoA carboxylase biotin carboxyl carrier protein
MVTLSGPPTPVGRIGAVLVANRGEIACRVLRTVRRLGRVGIAVYSDADADARHVREADVAVRLGPAAARESYLAIDRVVAAARRSGADAVHPGYGFLAENAAFARACLDAGLVWIGPPPEAIEAMGDKISAKTLVAAAGVPVVPGRAEPGMSDDDLAAAAEEIGWPVLVKPSAGGGGKGMHVVTAAADLMPALQRARREAASAFGDDTLFLERFVLRPRHIEVQVLADGHGNVVHLGERECSLQRRHQKVIEEAPSPLLDAATRDRIGAAACDTARSVGYAGAGTVEFIVSADRPDEFFFMEMNTRLQVEHPVTELVTGEDMVARQIAIAEGRPLGLTQAEIVLQGHAVEARVYAEDPAAGFLPTSGTVRLLREPDATGDPLVRVDSGLLPGTVVGTDYDPMLAKVIAAGADRTDALRRLDRALAETVVLGVTTNVGFLRDLLAQPRVQRGDLDTGLIDGLQVRPATVPPAAYAAAVLHRVAMTPAGADPWERGDGWRLGALRAPRRQRVQDAAGDALEVGLAELSPGRFELTVGDAPPVPVVVHSADDDGLDMSLGDRRCRALVAGDAAATWVHLDGVTHVITELPPQRLRGGAAAAGHGELRSPMPGTVIAVPVAVGEPVPAGAAVAVVEAMKMEHTVAAVADGVVAEVLVRPGDAVAKDQVLARLDPA